jgi:hypothetical protein
VERHRFDADPDPDPDPTPGFYTFWKIRKSFKDLKIHSSVSYVVLSFSSPNSIVGVLIYNILESF